ncbi:MAG: NAD(P)H-binding protein [Pseudomonadota bacterium]
MIHVVMAGGSGLIGRELLNLFAQEEKIAAIYSLARSKRDHLPSKVTEIVTNFDSIQELELPTCDVGLCSLGTTMKQAGSKENFYKVDHDYVLNFAKLCKKIGVKKFIVVSAMGANVKSKVYYNQVKGQTEEDLKSLSFESLVILRPSLLLGDRSEFRLGEWIAQKMMGPLNFLFVGSLAQWKPISGLKVAKRMCAESTSSAPQKTSKCRVLSNHEI